MFTIDMHGCDIVLGDEWLCTLGMVTMHFKELYMSFLKDPDTHMLQDINARPPKIISSHHMEKILKKGHSWIISQSYAIQGFETTPLAPLLEMKQLLATYSLFFELPIGLPPIRGEHDHSIPLILGSYLPYFPPL